MATVKQVLPIGGARLRNTNSAQYVNQNGTNYPVSGYAYDAATAEDIFFAARAVNYGSGNLTLKLGWYADTATSGAVVWGAAIAAITPDTDTQDIETDALATAATVTDTHLGTTGQRLHQAQITITALDSLAADDYVTIRIYRDAANASDTMAGDAILVQVVLEYSDT